MPCSRMDTANDGYLFFVRDRTLLAQRFDPSGGEVTGDATVVVRPIVPGEGRRVAAFSAAAGTVVYRRWIAPHNRLLWVDRRGTPQGAIGPERVDYDYIALSPDTRYAAVALRDWISGRRDLWLVIRNGQSPISSRSHLAGSRLSDLGAGWQPGSSTLRRKRASGISTRVP